MIAAIALWVAVVTYLVGFLRFVKPLAESSLDNIMGAARDTLEYEARMYPSTFASEHPKGMPTLVPTTAGRARAARHGVARALIWPVTVPMLTLSRTVTSSAEREQVARKELERIKALAKAEGLEWPEAK